ncbi:MAG: glycosyltransferase family 39 protein [Planctomycetes bacterium]|nr:glycosyltransferase family 39 protein [Planctomycetota bacterium]MBI3844976.1 glycosyltransferase family 39 protein [Planctomycetota bacterium]
MTGRYSRRVRPLDKTDTGDRFLIAVLVALSLSLLIGLGTRSLFDPDESRYAEIPREMLATGDFIVPHLWGVPYLEKPPLGYWLVAGAFALLGTSEWVARLVPALFTVATIALVGVHGSRLLGRRGGLLAAVVLASSAFPLALGRTLVLDPILSFFVTAILLCGHRLCIGDGNAPRLRVAVAIAAALGTLTKGPIAVLLPVVALVASQIVRRDVRALRRLVSLPSVALYVAVVAPWFVAVSIREADFPRFFVVEQHLRRYASPEYEHGENAWTLIGTALGGLGPWLFALPGALLALRRCERTDVALGAAIWALVMVAVFLPSQSKLVTYVLPAFPAMACLIAASLSTASLRGPAIATAIVFAAGAITIPLLPAFGGQWNEALRRLEPAIAGGAVAAGLAAWVAPRSRDAAVASLAAVSVCFLVGAESAAVEMTPWLCSREIAGVLGEQRRADEPVLNYGSPHRHSLVYYSRLFPIQVGSSGENEYGFRLAGEKDRRWFGDRDDLRRAIGDARSVWLVVDERNENRVKAQLRGYEVELVRRQGEARLFHVKLPPTAIGDDVK